MTLPCLRNTDAGVELFLSVQPRASRNRVAGIQGEELKKLYTERQMEPAMSDEGWKPESSVGLA